MVLMGCTAELPETARPQGNAISMSAYVAQPTTATRAETGLVTGKTIPDGGSIGVYAIYHENSTWGEDYDRYLAMDPVGKAALKALYTPNFMKNQRVQYSALYDSWTYTPLKYWPNTPTDKLSFMAYYPYNDASTEDRNRLGFAPGFMDGMPYLSVTTKHNVDEQVDILMSDLLADLPNGTTAVTPSATPDRAGLTTTDRVHFYFRHVLSKVTFRFVVQPSIVEDVADLTVNSISLTNIYDNGNVIPSYDRSTKETSFAWSMHTEEHKYDYTFQPDEPQLMLPQPLSRTGEADDPSTATANLTVNFTLTLRSYDTSYTYDADKNPVETPTYSYTREYTVPISTLCIKGTSTPVTEWLPNTHYIYTFRIGANSIDFTAQVVDWGDAIPVNDINLEEQ